MEWSIYLNAHIPVESHQNTTRPTQVIRPSLDSNIVFIDIEFAPLVSLRHKVVTRKAYSVPKLWLINYHGE